MVVPEVSNKTDDGDGDKSKSTARPTVRTKVPQQSQDGSMTPDTPTIHPQDAAPEAPASPSSPGAANGAAGVSEVSERSVEYLVSIRAGATLNPASRTASLLDALKAMPDVSILRTVKPSGSNLLSATGDSGSDIHVIATTPERAANLQASAAVTPDVVVEPNHPLMHLGAPAPTLAVAPTALPPPAALSTSVQFKILNDVGQPLARASVTLWGSGFPVQGTTDSNGQVTVVFAGALNTAQAIYVKPFADYWEKWVWNPSLSNSVNSISLQPLSSFQQASFPGDPFLGWGQKMMGLNQQSASQLTGQGSRVAIVDSGCDKTHPALTHIKIGRDFTNLDAAGNPDQQSWAIDTVSHGTHCAGIIAGNGRGAIRGFAPAAEVHILKLFEGGSFDSLIRSLKYAIDNQIDVVNCSLGSDQSSELVQNWMEQARQAGVAVVVAAGNSSNAVQFPGSLPGVLTVSAVGHEGEYPSDTYHAQTELPNLVGVNGIFAAKFTCFGPQVKVCGPGVAIISSVPGGGYAAWDGTSMAAPHLTGLTALVAAHHPRFANKSAPRNAARVDTLFQTVIAAASSVGLAPTYTGAGLPSATRALQTSFAQPITVQNVAAQPDLTSLITQAILAELAKASGAQSILGQQQ